MNSPPETRQTVEILLAARRIANMALDEGAHAGEVSRVTCEHMGAVLADSVLQAGLNYVGVVRPRIIAILRDYAGFDTVSALLGLIAEGKTSSFLNWRHNEKINRFEVLVTFLGKWEIEHVADLRSALDTVAFCDAVQRLSGIGPKTVDYMACLVGIDSIAVDRHVRSFARSAGVENDDYHFLRKAFCCAADLLVLPRREFDAWLWKRAVQKSQKQLTLSF